VSLSSTCIERPILTIVISIAIVVFGIIGFTFLGVREYPNVDPAVITVNTNYAGTNADVIDSQITQRLEEAISGVSGIDEIQHVALLAQLEKLIACALRQKPQYGIHQRRRQHVFKIGIRARKQLAIYVCDFFQ